jgi:hypothetical protein
MNKIMSHIWIKGMATAGVTLLLDHLPPHLPLAIVVKSSELYMFSALGPNK